MAHGDPVDQGSYGSGAYWTSWKLLDAAVATTTGVWIDVRGFRNFSVDITGISIATVQLQGSNAATKPSNVTAGTQLGVDITEDSFISIDLPLRWMKAVVSNYTSGTINAVLTSSVP